MISNRPGTCRTCGHDFPAFVPIFYDPKEGTHHWDCWESRPQPERVIQLADELGFTAPQLQSQDKDWSF